MKNKIVLSVAGIILLFVSCTESRLLTKQITRYPQPLGYKHTFTGDTSAHRRADLVLDYYGLDLNPATKVQRRGSFALPFIVVNYFYYKYHITLGADLMEQDYNQFLFQSIVEESRLNGTFNLSFDSIAPRSAYHLEVYLSDCSSKTSYTEKTLLVLTDNSSSTDYWESGHPAQSSLSCRIVLSKWDSVSKDTVITASSKLPFPGRSGLSREAMMDLSAGNLVESLCRSTEQCVKEMIQTVNYEISHQNL